MDVKIHCFSLTPLFPRFKLGCFSGDVTCCMKQGEVDYHSWQHPAGLCCCQGVCQQTVQRHQHLVFCIFQYGVQYGCRARGAFEGCECTLL